MNSGRGLVSPIAQRIPRIDATTALAPVGYPAKGNPAALPFLFRDLEQTGDGHQSARGVGQLRSFFSSPGSGFSFPTSHNGAAPSALAVRTVLPSAPKATANTIPECGREGRPRGRHPSPESGAVQTQVNTPSAAGFLFTDALRGGCEGVKEMNRPVPKGRNKPAPRALRKHQRFPIHFTAAPTVSDSE